MTNKTKIIIAGIGGVGGYIGGLLAKQFEESTNVEIYFLARGEHLKQIQTNGLKVIKGNTEFIAKPKLATDNANEIGFADYIIFCTKSYDLETTIEQLRPSINKNTLLLPLLNGVDSADIIKSILPDNIMAQGCIYIVSRLKEKGVIEKSGNIEKLFFGIDRTTNTKLLLLEQLFKEACIDATLTDEISTIVWEKYIFISPTATATSYFDYCIGMLLKEKEDIIIKLINEVKNIANARGINIDSHILEKTVNKLKSLPYETTSSMHSDFKNKKIKTELATLTEYVIKQGQEFNCNTHTYNEMFEKLKSK